MSDIRDYLPYVVSVGTAFGGWVIGKKKREAEAEVAEGNALQEMQKAYTTMIRDTNARLQEQSQLIQEQSQRINDLENRLDDCIKKTKK